MGAKKINIAVFLEQVLSHGGGFQQSLTDLLEINKLGSENFSITVFTLFQENVSVLKEFDIHVEYLKVSKLSKIILGVRRFLIINQIFKPTKRNTLEKKLYKLGIELCYFLGPSKLPLYLENLNYIVTVWDLAHRDMPEFPEMRNNFQFEKREYIYKSILTKAVAVIADSETGKENIIRRYQVEPTRVLIKRFTPSMQVLNSKDEQLDIKNKFHLTKNYIFYPAQFWPHKNHVYIIDALQLLKEQYNYELEVVFCGSDKGNLNYVIEYSRRCGVNSLVHYLGFVSKSEYTALFKNATALVMPTYFGPTNIPPLEAFKLGVPVLYSDLPEFRRELKNAVIYIDLLKPSDLAEKLFLLVNKDLDIKTFLHNGEIYSSSLDKENFTFSLSSLLENYLAKCKCHQL